MESYLKRWLTGSCDPLYSFLMRNEWCWGVPKSLILSSHCLFSVLFGYEGGDGRDGTQRFKGGNPKLTLESKHHTSSPDSFGARRGEALIQHSSTVHFLTRYARGVERGERVQSDTGIWGPHNKSKSWSSVSVSYVLYIFVSNHPTLSLGWETLRSL